jgi:hypothetical protein
MGEWIGWCRPHASGPWRRAAAGDRLGSCHKALLAAARRFGLGRASGDRFMTRGQRPPDTSGRKGEVRP